GVPSPDGPAVVGAAISELTSLVSTYTETKTVAPSAAGGGTRFRCGSPASPFEQEGAARRDSPRAGRLCTPSIRPLPPPLAATNCAGPPAGPDTGSLCCAVRPEPGSAAGKFGISVSISPELRTTRAEFTLTLSAAKPGVTWRESLRR